MTAHWLATARLPREELVPLAIAGDRFAVDALAKAWRPHVYRWCHRLGGPGFDAEDAAHEVLIVMCRRLPGLRDPATFPSWLFAITRRVMANQRRKAWWRRWLPGATVGDRPIEGPGPEDVAEARLAAERVWAVLETMADNHREVLILCELEERSATEASQLLGIPTGTVKSRLRVARTRFREALDAGQTQPESRMAPGRT